MKQISLRPCLLTPEQRVLAVCSILGQAGTWRAAPDTLLQAVEAVRDIEQAVLYDMRQDREEE